MPATDQPDTPSVAPIPPEHLLHTYIQTRYDLHHLAALTHVPIPDLLAWLARPETQATLAELRAAARQALELRAIETRRTALDTLEDVINTTDDPIEKRRAATALLRALNTRPRPADPAFPQDARPRTQDDSQTSKPQPSKPTPDLESLLQTLAHKLTTDTPESPTADNALAALHAACAEGATLDDKPIPEDLDDFLDDADDLRNLKPVARVEIAPPTLATDAAATRLVCVHHDETTTNLNVALADEGGWRIVAILTEPPDTS